MLGEQLRKSRVEVWAYCLMPNHVQQVSCHRIRPEKYRMQEKCLDEVAAAAKIPTVVRSYDDFCQGFLVGR